MVAGVRALIRRTMTTVAATAVVSLALFMMLGALGHALAPKWQVRPFADHIVPATSDTTIQAKDRATGGSLSTPQEGAYQTKETHITVKLDGGVTVNAIVREPIGAPNDHPACLFLHGSGTGKSSEAYGDVAGAMASAGITTLVPDKRLDNYTMLNRDYVSSARDYAKSLAILRSWPGVDASKTGLYAESEGTWIATVLTTEHPEIAFAILTSPPVVSGRRQMTLAATNYLADAGAPDAVKRLIPRITSLGTRHIGLAYADFDAAKYRRSLTMPLLINYGVRDDAMPVEQGARLLIRAANKAGNTNVTLRYYDANHQLRTGSNKTVPGLPLERHYTHDLEDWVNAVADGTGASDWTTPMVAGARPDQKIAAPTSTKPGLVSSLDEVIAAIAGCLLFAALATVGSLMLLGAGLTRRLRSGDGFGRTGSSRMPAGNPNAAEGLACGPRNPCNPLETRRFPTALRAALSVNVVLAVGTTCVFLAYLVTVIRDAIALTSDSTLLARNWNFVASAARLGVVAFAWLAVELVATFLERRHTKDGVSKANTSKAVTEKDHRAMTEIRYVNGKAGIGSGHVAVATFVVSSAALSLALLAFWGLFV